jgi:hypothetical protein
VLFWKGDGYDYIAIAAGAIDGTLGVTLDGHTYGQGVQTQLRRWPSQDGGVNRGVGRSGAPNVMDTTPENQAATSRDQNQVWPVRVIRRGDAVRPLPPHARSLADLTFEVGDVRLSLSDYMASHRAAGLLILKDGEIALERYGTSSGPERRWQSYSTA